MINHTLRHLNDENVSLEPVFFRKSRKRYGRDCLSHSIWGRGCLLSSVLRMVLLRWCLWVCFIIALWVGFGFRGNGWRKSFFFSTFLSNTFACWLWMVLPICLAVGYSSPCPCLVVCVVGVFCFIGGLCWLVLVFKFGVFIHCRLVEVTENYYTIMSSYIEHSEHSFKLHRRYT